MTKRISIIGSSSAASSLPGWNDYEFQQIERHFLTEGIIQDVGSAFAVVERAAGANMSVDVGSGRALVEITNTNLAHGETYKVWFDNDATVNLSVTTADGTFERIDRVVLRVDIATDPDGSAANVAVIEVLAGTPDAAPSAPATPSNAISLATISVPASDTTIGTAQITDDRSFVQLDADVLQDVTRTSDFDSTVLAIENDTPTWLGTITGTDTLTGGTTPAKTAYVAGQRFAFIVANTNTGAVTLNIDGLGAKNLFALDGAALAADEIIQGGIVECRYDGTQFVMTCAKHSTQTPPMVNLYRTITDSDNQVSTYASFNQSFSIPAGSLAAGDELEIFLSVESNAANCQTKLRIGGTDIGTTPEYSVSGYIKAHCTVRSLGATGVIECYAYGQEDTGSQVGQVTSLTIDTTAGITVDAQGQKNSGAGSVNHLTQLSIKKFLAPA